MWKIHKYSVLAFFFAAFSMGFSKESNVVKGQAINNLIDKIVKNIKESREKDFNKLYVWSGGSKELKALFEDLNSQLLFDAQSNDVELVSHVTYNPNSGFPGFINGRPTEFLIHPETILNLNVKNQKVGESGIHIQLGICKTPTGEYAISGLKYADSRSLVPGKELERVSIDPRQVYEFSYRTDKKIELGVFCESEIFQGILDVEPLGSISTKGSYVLGEMIPFNGKLSLKVKNLSEKKISIVFFKRENAGKGSNAEKGGAKKYEKGDGQCFLIFGPTQRTETKIHPTPFPPEAERRPPFPKLN